MKQLKILLKALILKIIHPSYMMLCADTKSGIIENDVEIISFVDYNRRTQKYIVFKMPTLIY